MTVALLDNPVEEAAAHLLFGGLRSAAARAGAVSVGPVFDLGNFVWLHKLLDGAGIPFVTSMQFDADAVLLPIKNAGVQTVVARDVFDRIDGREAVRLLDEICRVAKHFVGLSLTMGLFPGDEVWSRQRPDQSWETAYSKTFLTQAFNANGFDIDDAYAPRLSSGAVCIARRREE